MSPLDPKTGVYIFGTRFAISCQQNSHTHKMEWRLLEANPSSRCYEVVCLHADPVRLVMDLISHHTLRTNANEISTLDHHRETVEILSRRCETAINLLDPDKLGGCMSMRHATIDFTVSPVTYSPQMAFKYWWNHPRHEAVSYPKPLTREIVQGQAILNDIASLPQHLRYRYQKRYQSLISEKGLHEAHHFLYFSFIKKSGHDCQLSINVMKCLLKTGPCPLSIPQIFLISICCLT
ncbi:DUF5405 family protein [Candidatus Arsenophonus triatominarum]|uniref:DUF5405 family protein n=1 Tax=Candidatus Arsenophonus triatominarum TaxID=57911 RepID=UPI0007C53468|nr:DUF5405 family protein [Candidatus Arsenophonus triatominarum]